MYKFIYCSVSFAANPHFIKNLKEAFEVEIPYCTMQEFSPDLKESLDSYFYIENTGKFLSTYKGICKKYPKISFTILGTIRGNDILKFFQTCRGENKNAFRIGDPIKVLEGPYKNLSAKVVRAYGSQVEIEFSLLKSMKRLTFKNSEVVFHDSYCELLTDKFKNLELSAKKQGKHKALIVDGNDCLYRCMQNTPHKYNSKEQYVGGIIGFYFSLLKLKELYPEFEIHVVFEEGGLRYSQMSDKLRKAFDLNKLWGQNLVLSLGFYLYLDPIQKTRNIIATLCNQFTDSNFEEIFIHSTKQIFHTLVSNKVTLYSPKTTFRGNSNFYTPSKNLEYWGVDSVDKILWYLAVFGDCEGLATSVEKFFVTNLNLGGVKVREQDFKNVLAYSKTKEDLLTHTNIADFSEQFEKNLQALSLCDTLEITPEKYDIDESKIFAILEDVEMYKEIELWDRSGRIFRGLW